MRYPANPLKVYLMKSPENVKRIKAAEQEIRDGKGKVIAPEDIWK